MHHQSPSTRLHRFVFVCLFFGSTWAAISELHMPEMLQNCYRKFASQTSVMSTVGEYIGFYCNQQYSWRSSAVNNWLSFNMTRVQYDWLNSLLPRPDLRPQSTGYDSKPNIRVRKELRALTDYERTQYHRAVQMLKADTTVPPNKYDALAALHQGIATTTAHGGPNFVGWHRVYCLMFENALNEKIPGVALPYWASTLDSRMSDPVTSVLWTDQFFGNGVGIVNKGPYADWMTDSGPLIRNIGDSGGYTFREDDVKKVLEKIRSVDIMEPLASPLHNLEFFHGRVHDYVDGQMSELATASFDPVFFAHHAFVDFIWEVFRMQQRKNGIDPQLDYPDFVNNTMHDARAPLGFGHYRNIDSFSDKFIDGIYTYDPVPTCSVQKQDCGSPYLRCEVRQNIGYCVSEDYRVLDKVRAQVASQQTTSGQNMGTMFTTGKVMDGSQIDFFESQLKNQRAKDKFSFKTPGVMPMVALQNNIMGNARMTPFMQESVQILPPVSQIQWNNIKNIAQNFLPRMTKNPMANNNFEGRFTAGMNPEFFPRGSNHYNPGMGVMNSTMTSHNQQQPMGAAGQGTCPNIAITQGYQNKFSINGYADITQWVYIPVKIIYKRPPTFTKYASYPIRDNAISYKQDIYSPLGFTMLKDRLATSNLATYPTCGNKDIAAGTVYVQSNGMNYLGTYKEFTVVDQRQALSMATTYVAVKNPEVGHSDVMITAFDSCGRVCVPFCSVPGSGSGATRACSGAIRLTSESPKMYGGNYGQAILDTWSLSSGRHCPTLENNQVFISFYCNYEEAWPFVGTEAPPTRVSMPQPVPIPMPQPMPAPIPAPMPAPLPVSQPLVPIATHMVAMVSCQLASGCIIKDYCHPCVEGAVRQCEGTCSLYVQCQRGNYVLQRCNGQMKFDPLYGRCINATPVTCPEEETIMGGAHSSSRSSKPAINIHADGDK